MKNKDVKVTIKAKIVGGDIVISSSVRGATRALLVIVAERVISEVKKDAISKLGYFADGFSESILEEFNEKALGLAKVEIMDELLKNYEDEK